MAQGRLRDAQATFGEAMSVAEGSGRGVGFGGGQRTSGSARPISAWPSAEISISAPTNLFVRADTANDMDSLRTPTALAVVAVMLAEAEGDLAEPRARDAGAAGVPR